MEISEEQKKEYDSLVKEKQREFDINHKPPIYGIGDAQVAVAPFAQGFARPDVFAPVVIRGSTHLWDTFDTTVHPDAAKIKTLVGTWIDTAAASGRSCFIEGDCGTGKTHLGKAIADARPYVPAMTNGACAWLVNETSLIERYKATWGRPESGAKLIDELMLPDILIFDDLGSYQTRDESWLENIYYSIFDGRCERGKACLFLSNLPLRGRNSFGKLQDRIGDRSYDRLLGAISIRNDPVAGKPLGTIIGYWHGELYMPSARSGTIYTKILGAVKNAISRPEFNS